MRSKIVIKSPPIIYVAAACTQPTAVGFQWNPALPLFVNGRMIQFSDLHAVLLDELQSVLRLRPNLKATLQVYGRAAPTLWINIGHRFGEIPSMSIKILGVVLALAIRVVFRFGKNLGASGPRALTMAQGVFDTYLDNARGVRHDTALGYGEAALTGAHLDTVIGDPQTHGKAKSVPQPRRCSTGIGVVKNGNDRAGRNGTVVAHGGLSNRVKAARNLLYVLDGSVKWQPVRPIGRHAHYTLSLSFSACGNELNAINKTFMPVRSRIRQQGYPSVGAHWRDKKPQLKGKGLRDLAAGSLQPDLILL